MKKRKNVSKDIEQQWFNRYLKGETARNIAKDYPDFHESTVMRHIKKAGISRGNVPYDIYINRENIKNDYIEHNMYCEDLAKKYNVDVHTIYSILDSYGIKRKTGIKTSCDDTYFEKIDTPDKAYLLGFITADGSIIGKYHGTCRIEIHEKDRDLLEYAKEQINPTAVINKINHNGKNNVQISFNSVKLCKDLAKYNVVPNKSKIITCVPIEEIPKSLLKFYFRGLIDGDGCIHKEGGVSIYSGSKEYITSVQQILCKEANLTQLKIYHGTSYFVSWHSKEDRQNLYDYLYKDCLEDCFYYKRKYQRLFNSLYGNTEVTN